MRHGNFGKTELKDYVKRDYLGFFRRSLYRFTYWLATKTQASHPGKGISFDEFHGAILIKALSKKNYSEVSNILSVMPNLDKSGAELGPLHVAVSSRENRFVKLILESKAKVDVNKKAANGLSALQLIPGLLQDATPNEKTELTKIAGTLMNYGASPASS
jgi:hypothetical protein